MLNPKNRPCKVCGNNDPKKITLVEILGEACRIQCQICRLIYFDRINYPIPTYNEEYNKIFFRPTDIRKAGIMACELTLLSKKRTDNPKILEVGPGNGLTSILLKYMGIHISVIDVDDKLCSELNNKYNIPTYCMPFESLQGNNNFDLIYAGHTIEHSEDILTFFTTARSLLKEGGLFVFDTPNAEYWTNEGTAWKHFRTRQPYEHCSLLSEKTIRLIAGSMNFELINIELSEPYQSLYVILEKSC